MKKCIFLAMLVFSACDSMQEGPIEAEGKEKIDINYQLDLDTISEDDVYDDRIMVRIKPGVKVLKETKFPIEVIEKNEVLGIQAIKLPEGVDVFEFVEELRETGDYSFVEPNIRVDMNPPEFEGELDIKIEQ